MSAATHRQALAARVGARLRGTRKARSLSQGDIASLLNVNPAEVSRHETGQRCPTVPLLARYAEVLEVPLPDLLDFEAPIRGPA